MSKTAISNKTTDIEMSQETTVTNIDNLSAGAQEIKAAPKPKNNARSKKNQLDTVRQSRPYRISPLPRTTNMFRIFIISENHERTSRDVNQREAMRISKQYGLPIVVR